jgi:L-amino acid N-acyltransferase
MLIRKANKNDLRDIMSIMNYYIEHSTTTFDLFPKKKEEVEQWYEQFQTTYPLLIAEKDNQIIGYTCLTPYKLKEAYKQTVELSIYVANGTKGRGVGMALMTAIIAEAQKRNYHTILSLITTENVGSSIFHEKFGFEKVGQLKEVGLKFNKQLDVSIYQRLLDQS